MIQFIDNDTNTYMKHTRYRCRDMVHGITEYITPCPWEERPRGDVAMVGSPACELYCPFFHHADKGKGIVFCHHR